MKLINIFVLAMRLFLSMGIIHGFAHVVYEMAQSALHAQTHNTFTAKKFNQLLWLNAPGREGSEAK